MGEIILLEYFTPYNWDDYTHTFLRNYNSEINQYVPDSLQFIHNYTDNFSDVSRFIPHLMVSASLGMNHIVFSLIVGLAFLILCFLCGYIGSSGNIKTLPLTFIASFLIILMSGFFVGFLWLSGICNYLFVAILISLFFILLKSRKITDYNSLGIRLGLFVFGFITGWTNEGFVVGLAGATFIYFILFKQKDLNKNRLLLLIGFYLGALCLCLSPWNLWRFFNGRNGSSLVDVIFNLANSIISLKNLVIFYILILALINFLIFYIANRKHQPGIFIEFLKNNIILITSLFITLVFIILTNFINPGSRIPIEFYSLLLLVRLLSKININHLNLIAIITSIIVITSFIFVLPKASLNYSQYKDLEKQLKTDSALIITKSFSPSKFEEKFIIPLNKQYFPLSWVTPEMISKFHGNYNNPTFIDESIYNKMRTSKNQWETISERSLKTKWINVPINVEIDSVILLLRSPRKDEIPFYFVPFKDKLDRYRLKSLPTDNYDFIEIDGEKWLFIGPYPMEEISRRVIGTKIIYHPKKDLR